jgi:diguanylate cyclase (GGDEF)-like protein
MKENTPIATWIQPDPVIVDAGATLATSLRLMGERRIGAVLVTEAGRLAGIFTERDLLRLFSGHSTASAPELLCQPLGRFMTRDPVSAQAREDHNSVYQKMKRHNIRHIPVLDGQRLVGIVSMRDLLRVYQNELESAFHDTRRELESLRQLAGASSGGLLENMAREIDRYRELSLTDELTGLFNKRYFLTRLQEEVVRARRFQTPLALIFCDLDHFKSVNDNYGHPAGDEVLRQAARLLSGALDELKVISRLRKSDIVARYGGEEFVIILPETGAEGARIAAEKMRQEIQRRRFAVPGGQLEVTMSFGVSELGSGDGDSAGLINQADEAMYRAKNGGRNRVVVYGGPAGP